MADFKAITTQEEFDSAISERLARAEKKIREEYKGWTSPDDLKALNSTHEQALADLKTAHSKEMEKYAGYDEKFKEQETQIRNLTVSSLKTKIANEKHLPYDAIEFIQGEDEKSITESADRLSKLASAQHSIGFTRNTETDANTKDGLWRDIANSLPSRN